MAETIFGAKIFLSQFFLILMGEGEKPATISAENRQTISAEKRPIIYYDFIVALLAARFLKFAKPTFTPKKFFTEFLYVF